MKNLSVKDIMTRNVMMAHEDWTLDQLAEFFIQWGISGAPVVTEKGELVGVVSLTDFVRSDGFQENAWQEEKELDFYRVLESRYAREEVAALRIRSQPVVTVGDIMTRVIFEVDENATLQEVADAMIRGHIHRVFVTRGKTLAGIVSAIDMLKVIRDM